MILLNGAQGISDVLAQALSQGATGLALARNLLAGASKSNQPVGDDSNGKATTAVAPSEPTT